MDCGILSNEVIVTIDSIVIKVTNPGVKRSGKKSVYTSRMSMLGCADMDASERYVVDDKGQKVAVILPIEEYEKLQEDLHDLAVVAERRDETTTSLDEWKKRHRY